MSITYGEFFRQLTGKKVDQFADLKAIDAVIEKSIGKKLHIESYGSNVVAKRGSVFHYTKRDENLNKKIDAYLAG